MTDFLPATVITEHPELAAPRTRGRGYPWRPFDAVPEDFFRGASSIGNVVPQGWMKGWSVKVASQVAGDMRQEIAQLPKRSAVKLVKSEVYDRMQEPADNGSLLHDYAANHLAAIAGCQFRAVDVPDELDVHAANMTDWIDRHVDTVVAIERTLYHPAIRVAGTVDAIVKTKGGQTVAIDFKTKVGKGLHEITPYLENAMQAWVLGNAAHIAIPEQHQLLDLPALDGFLLVYIGDDGHLTHPVNIGSEALGNLVRHAAGILDGIDRTGTSVFGPPVRYLTDSRSAPAQVDLPEDNNQTSAA